MNQLQMLVTLSCGKKACLRLEYDHTTTCQPLFMKLEKVTKVPARLLTVIISYGGKMLQPTTRLKTIKDFSSINISVKGIGGGGSDAGMLQSTTI